MKRHDGFTLIELLITITIMVVLLTLSVVSLRANQINARDEERTADIGIISQQLENYYRSGGDDPMYTPGEYPPTAYVNSEANVTAALRDINLKALRAPNVADTSPISFIVATTNAAQTPTESQYIYQPLTSTGALCALASDECRKFTIFYKLESNSTIQTITSKNQ